MSASPFSSSGTCRRQTCIDSNTPKKGKLIKQGEYQENEEDDMETNRLHSTDQHGISFINSALCYLMKIEFQPQFKQIHKVKLYGMTGMPITQQIDYQIHTGSNIKIIDEQWNNILRLVTTLKLKHITPSVLINSIVCYNYLYQTQKIIEASPEERKEIQRALSNSATFAYGHVNFQGEYDFSEEVLGDILKVDMKKAINLELCFFTCN